MAFEFITSTDEIREKMFEYIKPVYKNTMDFDVSYINWIYGVYDSESGIFITYVNSKGDNIKYILINKKGDIFYIVVNRYRYTFFQIPDELMKYGDTIQEGIRLYNNEKIRKRFKRSFLDEQEKCLSEITENMKDRCRPSVDINCYEDAERLFYKEDFNYYRICHLYNKATVADFDKYMSEAKMYAIRGKEYRNMISKISSYGNTLDEDEYMQISKDFQEAGYLFAGGIDDIYVEMTFAVIKKAYQCGVISAGYGTFIENYIKSCITLHSDKILTLRPISDFMNEYMRGEKFKSLEVYRKELEKLIYGWVEGFYFVLTTDEIREKIFTFLKPEYKIINDMDVTRINWITGIYDKGSGIFLTEIYYVSDGIARCGVNFYSYIIVMDNGCVFRVDNDYEFEKRMYNFRIPKKYEKLTEKIKEGIEFYKCERDYRRILSEDTQKQIKQIEALMDDRCHRNFIINCEEDARKLFLQANCNVNTILEIYNKKTISDFKKFATDNKILLWRGDRYLQLLNEVMSIAATDEDRCRSFTNACYLLWYGINDTYDREVLTVVKYMYNSCIMGKRQEDALRSYINTYAEGHPDKLKNIAPLMEFVKTRAEDGLLKKAVEKAEEFIFIQNNGKKL